MQSMILLLSLSVGCTICVGLVLAIPISMIVMGEFLICREFISVIHLPDKAVKTLVVV